MAVKREVSAGSAPAETYGIRMGGRGCRFRRLLKQNAAELKHLYSDVFSALAPQAVGFRDLSIHNDLVHLSRCCALDVTKLQRLQYGARAVADVKLRQDTGRVVLDRAFRGAESVGDLPVAVAAGHEAEDFELSLDQQIRWA